MVSLKFLKFCLFVFICEIVLLVFFSTPNYISRVMAIEGVNIEDALGSDVLRKIDGTTSSIFNKALIESDIYSGIWHSFIPTEDEKLTSEGIEDLGSSLFEYLDDRLTVLSFLLFQLIHRLVLLSYYLPATFIVTLAAFYSGYMLRKIKQGNFAFASPSMHRISIKLIILMVTLLPLFLMFPFPLSPYLYPIMYFIVSFMIMGIVANIAKRV